MAETSQNYTASRIGDGVFGAAIAAILAYLYLPVAVLIIFSFNDSNTLTLPLSGFTLKWYEELFGNSDLKKALFNSFYVATLATALTVVIGVPAAFALDRMNFPGKTLFRERLNDPSKAVIAFQRALELRPREPAVLHRLLDLHTERRQWRDAGRQPRRVL